MLDGHQVALAAGRNEITVTADVAGGSSKIYNLTIVREPAMEANYEGFLQTDSGWKYRCGLRMDHTLKCHATYHGPRRAAVRRKTRQRASLCKWR